MMIKISVITITYNAGACLQRTLDSVLTQDHPGVEHWIVDGASVDDTLALAGKYKAVSDRAGNGHVVRIQSEPDSGLYDAMNKGLHLATGDYVIYMNAGDYFPDAGVLSRIATLADRRPRPAVIYGDTDIVDNDGRYIGRRHLLPPEHLSWKSFRYGMLVCHQAFYARLDIARRHEYDLRYRHSADVDWCIRVMKEADTAGLPMVNAHSTVACYTKEGQTTVFHRASLMERFAVMCAHYGFCVAASMHLWFVVRAFIRQFKS